MNSNELLHGTTMIHDLTIKHKFWELDKKGNRMKFMFLATLTRDKLDQKKDKRVITKIPQHRMEIQQ